MVFLKTALLLLSLVLVPDHTFAFSEGEKYFKIKSAASAEFAEFCLQLNETSKTIIVNSCEEGNGSQLWNVDEHSRIHNHNVNATLRSGCIFNVNSTLIYERRCSRPESKLNKQFAKFSFNAFDEKLLNGYKAMQIQGPLPVQAGAVVTMKKPKPGKRSQMWKLVFVPLPQQLKLADNPCGPRGSRGTCGICTGDCDFDSDCEDGLRCARRHLFINRENVPGCFWGDDSDNERYSNKDYCFKPFDVSDSSIVNYVGECNKNRYKCKKCEGSCHDDGDCADGLVCKHRVGFEAVPGCEGESGELDMYGKNVCHDPKLPTVFVDRTNCTSFDNCTLCSTCETDDDCLGNLRCAEREVNTTVPGCDISTTTIPSYASDQNVCFKPLSFPGNGGIVNYVGECSDSTYLCNRCEAGCTVDADCKGGLLCMERNATEHVPGCFHAGGPLDMSGKNVCIDKPWKKELLWFGRRCRWLDGECPSCAGGCKDDHDCEGPLRCAKRDGLEEVPGCRWGPNTTDNEDFIGSWSYCFNPFNPPTDEDTVRYIGECSLNIPGYICGECEGGCKLDSDCQFGLKCLHRSSFENVPGCKDEGGDRDMYGKGICYDPTKFPVV